MDMANDLPARTAEAGGKLFELICSALGNERGVHLETAVSAAGALAGASVLRGSGIDLSHLKPGDYVIVEKVNEVGPMLIDTLTTLLSQNGVPATDVAAAVPDDHAPHKTVNELTSLLLPRFDQLVTQYEIPTEMQPFVAVRAVAQFILAGKDACSPGITVAIAADAMVRGAKTVPPR